MRALCKHTFYMCILWSLWDYPSRCHWWHLPKLVKVEKVSVFTEISFTCLGDILCPQIHFKYAYRWRPTENYHMPYDFWIPFVAIQLCTCQPLLHHTTSLLEVMRIQATRAGTSTIFGLLAVLGVLLWALARVRYLGKLARAQQALENLRALLKPS